MWIISPIVDTIFKLIHASGLFLYSLKIPKHGRFSDVIKWYTKRPVERNGLRITEFNFFILKSDQKYDASLLKWASAVLGKLPRGKFSNGKSPLVKLPRGEFPLGIFPWGKLHRGKLPRIWWCIFYTSFIKNEAWICHRTKFSFEFFLKSFLLHCALWNCRKSVPIGNLLGVL